MTVKSSKDSRIFLVDFNSDGRLFHILGPKLDRNFCPPLFFRNSNSSLTLELRAARPWFSGRNISELYAEAVPLKNFMMLNSVTSPNLQKRFPACEKLGNYAF